MSEESFEPWHVEDSRVVFEHPVLTLVEDALVLPNGVRTKWLRYASRPDSVCVICVDASGLVLVARQYNPVPGRVVHEFPGGAANAGESHVEAARRELVEEIGLYPRQIRQIGSFLVNNRRSAQKQHVFVAAEFEPRQRAPDPEELIGYEWLAVETIEQKIISGEFENSMLLAAWSIFRLAGRK
jgi:8-oxo-dGTP pyrophosphatase MutT (NUDIX family)